MPKRRLSSASDPVLDLPAEDVRPNRRGVRLFTALTIGLAFIALAVGRVDRTHGRDVIFFAREGETASSVAKPVAPETDIFISTLKRQNVPYQDERTALGTARALCVWFKNTGETFQHGVEQLARETPAWTVEQTDKFAKVATTTYCPDVKR